MTDVEPADKCPDGGQSLSRNNDANRLFSTKICDFCNSGELINLGRGHREFFCKRVQTGLPYVIGSAPDCNLDAAWTQSAWSPRTAKHATSTSSSPPSPTWRPVIDWAQISCCSEVQNCKKFVRLPNPYWRFQIFDHRERRQRDNISLTSLFSIRVVSLTPLTDKISWATPCSLHASVLLVIENDAKETTLGKTRNFPLGLSLWRRSGQNQPFLIAEIWK